MFGLYMTPKVSFVPKGRIIASNTNPLPINFGHMLSHFRCHIGNLFRLPIRSSCKICRWLSLLSDFIRKEAGEGGLSESGSHKKLNLLGMDLSLATIRPQRWRKGDTWQPLWVEPRSCFGCWTTLMFWLVGRGNHELGHTHVLTHCTACCWMLVGVAYVYNRCGGQGCGNHNDSSSLTWWTRWAWQPLWDWPRPWLDALHCLLLWAWPIDYRWGGRGCGNHNNSSSLM